ncbi:alpha/beta hydrolase [Flavobacterium enshiense]|uniref:alpha/beta fold hydrolase n=1 Tax=Flavobacterium enshiense TaxID=1341165 RepID=UPI00345CE2FB
MKTIIKKMIGITLLSIMSIQLSNAQTAATAKTQYVEINGDKIAYRSFGKGSPIVLANRMRGTLDTWDPLFLDGLAKTHRVITFDYPGIGYSTGTLPTDMSKVAKFVKDFTATIKVQKFAMLGWSWGGFVTQTTLLEYPNSVTHAVLVGTAPPGIKNDLPIQQKWVERALKPVNNLEDEEILFFEPDSEFSRRMAKESRDRIYARPGVVDKIASTMDIFQLFLKGHEKFKEDMNRREELTKTNIPILIICGDNDTSVPAEHWYKLSGKFKNAQILVYPESGHGPQHQYPELSAQYIDQFIKITK